MIVSLNEFKFIEAGINDNIRADGRQRLEFRQCVIETGLLPQASGSCRIRIDDIHGLGKTDILIGVKAEIGNIVVESVEEDAVEVGEAKDGFDQKEADGGTVEKAFKSKFNKGRLVCNVECAPSASGIFASGQRVDEIEKEYSNVLGRVLNGEHSGIELEKLVIVPNQQCWVIYVDALILSHGGQPIDALLMGCFAALEQTLLPKALLVTLESGEVDFEIDDDPNACTPIPGNLNIPIGVTLCKVGDQFIVDPTAIEASCASTQFLVAVNQWGKVCFLYKLGGGTVPVSQIANMVKAGRAVGVGLLRKLVTFLQSKKGDVDGVRGFLS